MRRGRRLPGRSAVEINADAGRGYVPPPPELEALLDAMLTIAGMNASVNSTTR